MCLDKIDLIGLLDGVLGIGGISDMSLVGVFGWITSNSLPVGGNINIRGKVGVFDIFLFDLLDTGVDINVSIDFSDTGGNGIVPDDFIATGVLRNVVFPGGGSDSGVSHETNG